MTSAHLAVGAACVALGLILGGANARAADAAAPEAVVQVQLDAYNARNMEAFLATYADDAELYGFPATLQTKGKDAMRTRYATTRFNDPALHAALVNRIVIGNTVIDHERVQATFPEGAGVRDAVAIYELRDGKIVKVTFIGGKLTLGAKL